MKDCIFCRIIAGEIPGQKIYETETVLVIRDIKPAAPVHLLVMPKEHIASLNELTREHEKLAFDLLWAAREAARILRVELDGYRLVSNCGIKAGQSVFHLHFHLLAGTVMRELKI